MRREISIFKNKKNGTIVKAFSNENVDLGEEYVKLKSNSEDASFEKHVPTFERKDGKIIIKVNHVMEVEHYIEWIAVFTEKEEVYKYFKPGDEPVLEIDEIENGIIYSYCNKHGLWSCEI